MKFSFFKDLFSSELPGDAGMTHPHDPPLQPMGVRTPTRATQQLPRALMAVAEQIADQEVRDFLDTGECRYQLWTLTLHLTQANRTALRSLLELSQRSSPVAKSFVERALAKAEAARWLDTTRLRLEFRDSEADQLNGAEVLMVVGQHSIVLPFGYSGQLQFVDERVAGAETAATTAPAAPPTGLVASGRSSGQLQIWAQLPGAAAMQVWRLDTGPVSVGADEAAAVRVEHRHVSGEHLRLSTDGHGRWMVEDRSRNGSNLLDAEAEEPESPLPTRVVRPLPQAGAIRLGPLPEHPVLNFRIKGSVPSVEVSSVDAASGARRTTHLITEHSKVTELPKRRSTTVN